MPEHMTSLHVPKLIGRLNQVHYIPVYDVNKEREKRRREPAPDWFDYLVKNYKFEKLESDRDYFPSTYVGVRHPPPVAKAELALNVPMSETLKTAQENNTAKEGKETIDKKNGEASGGKNEIKAQKLPRVMGVGTTSESDTPNSTLHLPQIMGSFLPTVSRKIPYKATTSSHSYWNDLTSQKKIKQVAPTNYKGHSKTETAHRRVTLFAVNYETNSSRKLKRRPLPPINESPQSSAQPPDAPPVWLPSLSQTSQMPTKQGPPEDKQQTAKTQETKVKALSTLLGRLDRQLPLPQRNPLPQVPQSNSRKKGNSLPQPSNSKKKDKHPGRWESNVGHKVLRSGRRPRHEGDRHFGSVRDGVVLNRPPPELMGGTQQSNFQSLEYYLGCVNQPRVKSDQVLYIPTGLPEDNTSPSSATKRHFFNNKMSFHQNNADVKMKYAHRGSDDTPPLEFIPWEEKTGAIIPQISTERSNEVNAPTSESKPKRVKHVTINIPRVPPPSPESLSGKPKSRGKRRRTLLAQQPTCHHCNEGEPRMPEMGVLPGIPAKLTPVNEQRDHVTDFGGILVNTAPKSLKKTEKLASDKLERRAKLIDRLVNAHGEMKKRHECPQKHDGPHKEVVIAPFKVTIEKERKSETKANSTKNEGKSTRSTTTKPFTFSYMPSKHNKKQSPKEEGKPSPPEIFNNQARTPRPPNTKKPSIISSFVAVNRSKEIYEALIRENQAHLDAVDAQALNKATDCDDLNQPITFSQANKVKDRELVKENILSQNSAFSDPSQLVSV